MARRKHKRPILPKRNNSLLSLIVVGLLLAGVLVTIALTQKPQEIRSRATGSGTLLAFNPSNKSLPVGQTLALGITMDTRDDTVSAAELHLTYDKTAIQVLSFTNGTLLPNVLTPASAGNGTFSVVLGANPASPYKGAGILGTLNIKTLIAKQSPIAFADSTAVAAIGKTTNALASKMESTITVTTGNTSAPTPTPTQRIIYVYPTPTPLTYTTYVNANTPPKASITSKPIAQIQTTPDENAPFQEITANDVMTPTAGSQNIFERIIIFFQNIFRGLSGTR